MAVRAIAQIDGPHCHLGKEGLAASWNPEDKAVSVHQFFPVAHVDIFTDLIDSVVNAGFVLQLLYVKGQKGSQRLGQHSTHGLHLPDADGKRRIHRLPLHQVMLIYCHRVALADRHDCIGDTVQLLLGFCQKYHGHRHIKEALVVIPHIVHDVLNLLLFISFSVRNFRREVVVPVPDTLLPDNIGFNSQILFLQNLSSQLFGNRNYINANHGMDRQTGDFI